MWPEPLVIAGIPLHFFGVFASLGLLLGYWVTYREMIRLRLPAEVLPDLTFSIMISAFVVARLFFVISNWQTFLASPIEIFKFWQGGLVYYGGLLGGLLGGYFFCRIRKLSFRSISDPVALGLALGMSIGRLGCLASGCCYGRFTQLPWGMVFNNPLAVARPLGVPLHPTQIYSFLIEVGIYISMFAVRKRKSFNGALLLGYLILVSVYRMVLEFFRAENQLLTAVVATVFLVVGGVFYVRLKFQKRETP